MKDYRVRSKERFESEITKLFKDFMVSCLDRAEKILRPDRDSKDWQQFRFGILNIGNDKIRSFRDTLKEYNIEFRPIIFSVEYNVDIPIEKLVEFNFEVREGGVPVFTVDARSPNLPTVLKDSLECGTYSTFENIHRYQVDGIYNVFHKVIPFFDSNNCFKGVTLVRFRLWKEQVYSLEKGNA